MGATAVVRAQHEARETGDRLLLTLPRVVRSGRYRLVLGLVLLLAAVLRLAALESGSHPSGVGYVSTRGGVQWSVFAMLAAGVSHLRSSLLTKRRAITLSLDASIAVQKEGCPCLAPHGCSPQGSSQ